MTTPSSILLVQASEPDRLRELRRYNMLDTQPETSFDLIVKLAATVLHVPIAWIGLVDETREWRKSAYGINAGQISRDNSFCSYVITRADPFVLPDANLDARFAENCQVTGEPRIRFFAGAPLRTPRGFVLGALCIADRAPRELNEEDSAILSGLAKLVIDEFELRLSFVEIANDSEQLRLARETAEQAVARFEAAQYDLICERVARQLSGFAEISHFAGRTPP